jgi:hypothetical protein
VKYKATYFLVGLLGEIKSELRLASAKEDVNSRAKSFDSQDYRNFETYADPKRQWLF